MEEVNYIYFSWFFIRSHKLTSATLSGQKQGSQPTESSSILERPTSFADCCKGCASPGFSICSANADTCKHPLHSSLSPLLTNACVMETFQVWSGSHRRASSTSYGRSAMHCLLGAPFALLQATFLTPNPTTLDLPTMTADIGCMMCSVADHLITAAFAHDPWAWPPVVASFVSVSWWVEQAVILLAQA